MADEKNRQGQGGENQGGQGQNRPNPDQQQQDKRRAPGSEEEFQGDQSQQRRGPGSNRTIWRTSGNALKYWLLIILNPPQAGGFFVGDQHK